MNNKTIVEIAKLYTKERIFILSKFKEITVLVDDEQEQKKKKAQVEVKNEYEGLTKSQIRAKKQQERAQKRKERKERIRQKKPWHPLRVLRGIGLFFLLIIKIIFFPYVYAYWKIRDSIKFLLRNDSEDLDRTLISVEDGDTISEGYIDEKGFLRSLPMFYFIAGTLGAVIAIFISFEFMKPVWYAIRDFFVNFSWANAWALFVDILEAIYVTFLWEMVLKPAGLGIWAALQYLFAGERFWVPLTILIALGVGIIIIAVIFSEADFSGKFIKKLKAFFSSILNFPRMLWKWIKNGYQGFQKGISRFTFGNDKIEFYQKRFFYRIVIYSSITTLWIVITVITLVIASEAAEVPIEHYDILYPVVLIIIGFANGILLLAFLSWLIGLLSGKKYIVNPAEFEKYKEERAKAKEAKMKEKEEKKQEKIEKRKKSSN